MTELDESGSKSIGNCRNFALEKGKSIFGLKKKLRQEEVWEEVWSNNTDSWEWELQLKWQSYWKCLVADNEDDMMNAGESDTCNLHHYVGSETAISFFRAVDPPANHVYTFEGLRTMNDAKEFCKTQGGPETKFGLDDNGAQTEGV